MQTCRWLQKRLDASTATVVNIFDTSRAGGTVEITGLTNNAASPVLTILSNGTQKIQVDGLTINGRGWADGSLTTLKVGSIVYTINDLLRSSPTPVSLEVHESNQYVVTGSGQDDIWVTGSNNVISTNSGNDRVRFDAAGNTFEASTNDGNDKITLGVGVLTAQNAFHLLLPVGIDLSTSSDVGSLILKIIATDPAGASASTTVNLSVMSASGQVFQECSGPLWVVSSHSN
jgi:hypothetical protein